MIDDRVCECGCGRSLALRRSDCKWATEGCKKRAKRGLPTRMPDGAGTPRGRNGRFVRHRSGAQISYWKGVRRLERFIGAQLHWTDPEAIREAAQEVLRPALPDKQRERLEAR